MDEIRNEVTGWFRATDLVIITPSRGRPHQLRELIDAVAMTADLPVRVLPCLDDDDPALEEYRRVLPLAPRLVGPRRSLSGWTNKAAHVLLGSGAPPRYLASFGDDHRPRTPGWDRHLIDAIEALPGGFGIAYGNDLLQGEALPTAWVVSSEIVRTVGWMMLPACDHMYVDTATFELGRAAGCIVYLPYVIIEHLHPIAGKAPWDASYRATNTTARYTADLAAFEAWKADGLEADAKEIVANLGRR